MQVRANMRVCTRTRGEEIVGEIRKSREGEREDVGWEFIPGLFEPGKCLRGVGSSFQKRTNRSPPRDRNAVGRSNFQPRDLRREDRLLARRGRGKERIAKFDYADISDDLMFLFAARVWIVSGDWYGAFVKKKRFRIFLNDRIKYPPIQAISSKKTSFYRLIYVHILNGILYTLFVREFVIIFIIESHFTTGKNSTWRYGMRLWHLMAVWLCQPHFSRWDHLPRIQDYFRETGFRACHLFFFLIEIRRQCTARYLSSGRRRLVCLAITTHP